MTQSWPGRGTNRKDETDEPHCPEGYTSVAPWVITDDPGALLDFVTAAFDGEEIAPVAAEDGTIGHGEFRIGDTVVLAFDRRPGWPVMPSLLRVFVPGAAAAMAAAVAHGARVVTATADSAWGASGRVRDPFGNIWWVGSRGETVARPDLAADVRAEVCRDDAQRPGDFGQPAPTGLCLCRCRGLSWSHGLRAEL